MKPPPDERALIAQAQRGDKVAIGTLYRAYVQPIFQYTSYRVETDEIAEDITANVFLRMIEALPKYRYTGAPLGAWLFRIASNCVADYYRENKRTTLTSLPDNYSNHEPDPSDQVSEEAERANLRHALQLLSDDYQNIITLRFMQELPHAQVAEIMEKSEGAVRVMQHRALQALDAILKKEGNIVNVKGGKIDG